MSSFDDGESTGGLRQRVINPEVPSTEPYHFSIDDDEEKKASLADVFNTNSHALKGKKESKLRTWAKKADANARACLTRTRTSISRLTHVDVEDGERITPLRRHCLNFWIDYKCFFFTVFVMAMLFIVFVLWDPYNIADDDTDTKDNRDSILPNDADSVLFHGPSHRHTKTPDSTSSKTSTRMDSYKIYTQHETPTLWDPVTDIETDAFYSIERWQMFDHLAHARVIPRMLEKNDTCLAGRHVLMNMNFIALRKSINDQDVRFFFNPVVHSTFGLQTSVLECSELLPDTECRQVMRPSGLELSYVEWIGPRQFTENKLYRSANSAEARCLFHCMDINSGQHAKIHYGLDKLS